MYGIEVPVSAQNEPRKLTVVLESFGNPDFGQDPARPVPGVPRKTVDVASMREASVACRSYITEHDLGGGNWPSGKISENGVLVALVSYNGRVWYPPGQTDETT